ncbi:MAG: sporulation transcriptional regulator SpoIIID [[Clostridium] scindens]|nr:sporulation transcriptional regulator SpoIIID [[Clostridium] scindens]MEE0647745.1 sporulation transcriptional regulator SpoIIID [[Clostridium] scindens]
MIWKHRLMMMRKLKQFYLATTKHKDVTERLLKINPSLAAEARKVLDMNKSERHIRGGMATREKYLHQHGQDAVGTSI